MNSSYLYIDLPYVMERTSSVNDISHVKQIIVAFVLYISLQAPHTSSLLYISYIEISKGCSHRFYLEREREREREKERKYNLNCTVHDALLFQVQPKGKLPQQHVYSWLKSRHNTTQHCCQLAAVTSSSRNLIS